jgi:predicted  nucleic acid-binding Zn-ribbon protein
MLMSDMNDNYLGVLLEKMSDELKAIHEEVGGMHEELKQVPKRGEFDDLKQDVKIIKAAVTDLSHQVSDHEHRITRLEATS